MRLYKWAGGITVNIGPCLVRITDGPQGPVLAAKYVGRRRGEEVSPRVLCGIKQKIANGMEQHFPAGATLTYADYLSIAVPMPRRRPPQRTLS